MNRETNNATEQLRQVAQQRAQRDRQQREEQATRDAAELAGWVHEGDKKRKEEAAAASRHEQAIQEARKEAAQRHAMSGAPTVEATGTASVPGTLPVSPLQLATTVGTPSLEPAAAAAAATAVLPAATLASAATTAKSQALLIWWSAVSADPDSALLRCRGVEFLSLCIGNILSDPTNVKFHAVKLTFFRAQTENVPNMGTLMRALGFDERDDTLVLMDAPATLVPVQVCLIDLQRAHIRAAQEPEAQNLAVVGTLKRFFRENPRDTLANAVPVLGKLIENIVKQPQDKKYQTIKVEMFRKKMAAAGHCEAVMQAIGFTMRDDLWVYTANDANQLAGYLRLVSATATAQLALDDRPPQQLHAHLSVGQSPIHGLGVFAKERLQEGFLLLKDTLVDSTDDLKHTFTKTNSPCVPPWLNLFTSLTHAEAVAMWQEHVTAEQAASHMTMRVDYEAQTIQVQVCRAVPLGHEALRAYGSEWLAQQRYHFEARYKKTLSNFDMFQQERLGNIFATPALRRAAFEAQVMFALDSSLTVQWAEVVALQQPLLLREGLEDSDPANPSQRHRIAWWCSPSQLKRWWFWLSQFSHTLPADSSQASMAAADRMRLQMQFSDLKGEPLWEEATKQ